jgi:hypothetical protein
MKWQAILSSLFSPRSTAEEIARLKDRVTAISQERDELKRILADAGPFAPPGHFYSPIPSLSDVEEHLDRLQRKSLLVELPAIRMDDGTQLEFLELLKPSYFQLPFQAGPVNGLLYQFDNPHFSYADGTALFCVLNYFRPQKLIEIGSGFSTCAILDTNRVSLGSRTQIISIEPHAKLLRSLIAKSHDSPTIIERKLQDTEPEVFDQLSAGDILFIDSTHICKAGSDVNYIIFEILPRIKSGVIVQIHDIHLAFEYPDVWLREGRAWNEAYLLRAFLEYNEHFRILLFLSYMQNAYEEWFRQNMPQTLLKKGGSFWMEKL